MPFHVPNLSIPEYSCTMVYDHGWIRTSLWFTAHLYEFLCCSTVPRWNRLGRGKTTGAIPSFSVEFPGWSKRAKLRSPAVKSEYRMTQNSDSAFSQHRIRVKSVRIPVTLESQF